MDMEKFENTGLAYINFRDHDKAVECQRYFTGFSSWPGEHFSERTCRAQWSSIQGYAANIEKQQRNDWVNSNIPEDCKPMVFDENGTRLPTMDIFPTSRRVDHGWRNYSLDSEGKAWTDEWYGGSSGVNSYLETGRTGQFSHSWSDNWQKNQSSNQRWQSEQSWHKENKHHKDRNWDRDKDDYWQSHWSGWNGRKDEWSDGHNQRQVLIEDTSGGYGKMSVPDFYYEDPKTEEGDKPGETPENSERVVQIGDGSTSAGYESDTKGINAMGAEVFQSPSDAVGSKELFQKKSGEPASLVATTRYVCPSCGACFAKWSACHHHILNEFICRKNLVSKDMEWIDLQARCKEKATELPNDHKSGKANDMSRDDAIVQEARRFQ
eukprot:Skav202514  [mRNA]  locus=scaffold1359:245000:246136:- [translate_table: standard]